MGRMCGKYRVRLRADAGNGQHMNTRGLQKDNWCCQTGKYPGAIRAFDKIQKDQFT
jgi:hypothetical protein